MSSETSISTAALAYEAMRQTWARTDSTVQDKLQLLNRETEEWRDIQKKANAKYLTLPTRIIFDVGGTRFATTAKTATGRFPRSLIAVMLASEMWTPSDGIYFLDRDPYYLE
jgi:hypothetical protein